MDNNSTKTFMLGQSFWYDNIQRYLLENGELAGMIQRGEIYGVTSNPSIFNNAITKTNDYDRDLVALGKQGKSASEIFGALAVDDIGSAARVFRGLYESTNGGDGYVSLEVDPSLANDSVGTCKDAQKLWEMLAQPNLMIKIPATKAGIPAIRQSIAAGINVNVTLIFSLERYQEVIGAYIAGLEDRIAASLPIDHIASVASFFISRIDSKVDAWLDGIAQTKGPNAQTALSLKGTIAIANAKMAYQLFRKIFATERFQTLKAKGARLQRPLWASTSTKNPSYPDVLYVDELIGPDTINTLPPATLAAFNDHGNVSYTLERELDSAGRALSDLERIGLSLSKASQELEEEGIAIFQEAFARLLESIDSRLKQTA